MSDSTTREIKKYSTDPNKDNALEALMDWYGANSLQKIPESAALKFLNMLKTGKVKI